VFSGQLLTTMSDHQYRRRLITRVVSFGHAHQSHGHKQLTESTRLSRRPHSQSRLSFINSTSIHLDGYRTTRQLSYNFDGCRPTDWKHARFYNVSVNFSDTRMPAGEHTITQRLCANTINFGAERLDSGAAISRDTGTHTRRRPSKHARTQTTQHTHKPN